jgi:hypothetical protein
VIRRFTSWKAPIPGYLCVSVCMDQGDFALSWLSCASVCDGRPCLGVSLPASLMSLMHNTPDRCVHWERQRCDTCLEPACCDRLEPCEVCCNGFELATRNRRRSLKSHSDHSRFTLPCRSMPKQEHYQDYLTSGRWWLQPVWQASSNIQKHRSFHSHHLSSNTIHPGQAFLPKPSSLDRHSTPTPHMLNEPHTVGYSLVLILHDHPSSFPFLRLTFMYCQHR